MSRDDCDADISVPGDGIELVHTGGCDECFDLGPVFSCPGCGRHCAPCFGTSESDLCDDCWCARRDPFVLHVQVPLDVCGRIGSRYVVCGRRSCNTCRGTS